MSYLLDTHILLWMLENDYRLSPSDFSRKLLIVLIHFLLV